MFTKRLSFIHKDQGGFTVIELLVAIALSSIVVVGLTMTIFNLYGGYFRSSGEMTVVRHAQQAGYWISRDVQMAQEVSTDDDQGTADVIELVTLTWYDYFWEEENPDRRGAGHRVIYTLVDDRLYREYYSAGRGEAFGSSPDYTTFVAEHIDVDNTSCIYLEGSNFYLIVTASVEGWQPQSETRTYEIKPRPNVY